MDSTCAGLDPTILAAVCPSQEDVCDPTFYVDKWCTEEHPSCSTIDEPTCCCLAPPPERRQLVPASVPDPQSEPSTLAAACPAFVAECCPLTCCDKPGDSITPEIVCGLLDTIPFGEPSAACDTYRYEFELCPCAPDDVVVEEKALLDMFVEEWCLDLVLGKSSDSNTKPSDKNPKKEVPEEDFTPEEMQCKKDCAAYVLACCPGIAPATKPLCFTNLEVTCTLAAPRQDGTLIPCRDAPIVDPVVDPVVDGECTKPGSYIEAVSFTYTGGDCSASTNNQGSEATCSDGIPIPDGEVTVMCLDTASLVNIETTPSTVSQGDQFVVSNSGGSLPNKIICTIRSGATVHQTTVIDVSAEVSLQIGDVFGALRIESLSCVDNDDDDDDDDCVKKVSITYTVTNIGPVDMQVESLLGEVVNTDAVSNDGSVQLVEFVNPNPVLVGETAMVEYRTEIDFCADQVIEIKGSVTALPTTKSREARLVRVFYFATTSGMRFHNTHAVGRAMRSLS
eukprot:scaffold35177_cov275-Amphora_coffeaeformis.AAC.1